MPCSAPGDPAIVIHSSRPRWFTLAPTLILLAASTAAAQAPPTPAPGRDAERKERFQKFEQALSGVKLVGHFTIVGREEQPLSKEEYTIHKVTKLPQGDLWLFEARIKYGRVDLTVPFPLAVHWAGDTPVITLDNVSIPGLGTFGARVVIDNGKYAGTWTHGALGGHLFGTIEKLAVEPEKKPKKSSTGDAGSEVRRPDQGSKSCWRVPRGFPCSPSGSLDRRCVPA